MVAATFAAMVLTAVVASSPATTSAQPGAPGTIATFAGGGAGDGASLTEASFYDPYALKVSDQGDLFVVDDVDCRVRKVSSGTVTTVAGGAGCGFGGDNGPANAAQLNRPSDVVVDHLGNMFIADAYNCRVREVSGGIITTVAGGGGCSDWGDGGPANQSGLAGALSVAVDAQNHLYIATACRIRLIDAGMITSVAGNDCAGSDGDGGPALLAHVVPRYMAVRGDGALHFSENWSGACRVRKVQNGIVTAVVGKQGPCTVASPGDGGPATDAFAQPWQLAFDGNDNLYLSDRGLCRIRKVDHATGIINTVVGSSCDIPPAPTPVIGNVFLALRGFTVSASGEIYAATYRLSAVGVQCPILRVEAGFAVDFAGATPCGFSPDGQAATNSAIGYAGVVKVAESGDAFFVQGCHVRRVHQGVVDTVAGRAECASATWGTTTTDGVQATSSSLHGLSDLALDPAGGFYIAESCAIRRIGAAGIISTAAGNASCTGGDVGPAADVALQSPIGLTVSPDGALYFGVGCRVARLSGGVVSTVAGSATNCGDTGDGGAGANALFESIAGLGLADDGTMYVLSGTYSACTIRRIATDGSVKTVAVTGHCASRLAVDRAGNVFYFDPQSCLVREVSGSANFPVAGKSGTCPVVFGGLDASYGMLAGDGGPADGAALTDGGALSAAPTGDLYIGDYWNLRIRVVYQPSFDADGDGYPDALERAIGKDPAVACKIMRADVDNDGAVSIVDLAAAAVNFGQATNPATARQDQDGDGVISILDLARQAARFGQHVTACG